MPPPDPRCELTLRVARTFEAHHFTRDGRDYWTQEHTVDVLVSGTLLAEGAPSFDAGTDLVALSQCGVCGLYECNQTRDYAAWVRRGGPSVFWLLPNTDIYVFDVEQYARALGGDVKLLPPVENDVDERIHRAEGSWAIEYVAVGGATLLCDLDWKDDGPWHDLRAWPAPASGIEPVAPPPDAIELRDPDAEATSIWLAPGDGRPRMYAPGIVRLPTWVAGPQVDALVRDAGF